jgi:hypothetical protein
MHVFLVRETKNTYTIVIGNPRGRNNFAVLGVEERIILKCMFEKYNVTTWTAVSKPVVICCKHINTSPNSITEGEIFT